MRLGLRFVFVLACVLGAAACASPTLPLPPPEAPSESAGTTPNTVVLVGAHAIPGALMIIANNNANLPASEQVTATKVGADGTWTATISAVKNDTLQITELVDNEATQTLFYTVLIN